MHQKEKADIYGNIIKKNGNEHQQCVAIEELAELTKELTKELRGKGSRTKIIEELADVLICADQLKLIHSITQAELDCFILFKLERLNKFYIEGNDK